MTPKFATLAAAWVRWVTVLALALFSAVTTLASEQIELLTTRGVVEFHQGLNAEAAQQPVEATAHYRAALALFTQALEAEPADVYARYYRGVTEGRLEQWDAAIADLRGVVERDSTISQARLELGIALVKSGHDDEAIDVLTAAQQVSDLDAAASFYLGMAQLHRHELSAARENFGRAARADPEFTAVCRYYEGLVELQAGNLETATERFEYVAQEARPDSAIRREAREFLIGLQQGDWPTQRRYQLYAGAGLAYDSNVQLAPTSEQLGTGFGKRSDGLAVISAGGNYFLWQAPHAQLSAGYDFFQSLYFDLTDFNLQEHRATLQATGGAGIVSGGVEGAFDYYLRQTNSFLAEGQVFPWLSVSEGEWGSTQVFYRLQRQDYKEAALRDALDSLENTVGIMQFLPLASPGRYAVAGYRYDVLTPADGAANVFMYHANQGWGGIGWLWPLAIATELDFAYRVKDFNPASGGRLDNEYRLVFTAQKPVARYTSVGLAYFGTFNQSNQPVFQYDRNIVSLTVQVRY
jgi:tetratricopeptide (TPR) repeat protein